jgi:hypothetical protein
MCTVSQPDKERRSASGSKAQGSVRGVQDGSSCHLSRLNRASNAAARSRGEHPSVVGEPRGMSRLFHLAAAW